MKFFGLLFSIACIFSSLGAQTNIEWKESNFPGKKTEFQKAYKTYQTAENMYYNGPPSYEGALVYYLEAYKFNPDNDYLNFHIGHIYFALHHPHEAEPYYEKAIQLNPGLRDQILFELALSYHQDGEWDMAISHYQEYKAYLEKGGHKNLNMHENDLKHELKYADLCIRQCETGKVLTHDTLPVLFENLGDHVNSKYPDYSPVVDHAENLLIFVSSRPGSTGDKNTHGTAFSYQDVYYSTRGADGWSRAASLLGDVNSHGHEAPVWLSGDGKRLLLYVDDSKSPNVNLHGDIYESDFENGKWTNPTPLKMINSKYRETHACFSNDGKTIYFTTNNPKYAKHGGLDIVKVIYDDATGTWSEPMDVGGKVNTEWNEESPFIKPDGKTFYFSSQGHTSIGGFDFFHCEVQPDGTFSEPENLGFPLNTTYDDVFIYVSDDGRRVYFNSDRIGGVGAADLYEGFILSAIQFPVELTILDAETKQPIKDAEIKIKMISSNTPSEMPVNNNADGMYLSSVGIMKSFEVSIEAPDHNGQTFSFNTKYDKMINFDTVKVRKTIYLEVNRSPIAFTGQLFDKITNNAVEGILEITNGNDKIAQVKTVDKKFSADLPRNKEYTVTVLAKGHMPYRETFKLTEKNNKKDYYLDRIKVGDRFAMRNVQYETGKATLKKESITELEILKEFMMENPYIRLEISAHTDIVGSRSSNLKLSDLRAKSVYDWLVKNGVDKARMTYKGYGPDMPIADNATPEGRALNRRAEIKIIE